MRDMLGALTEISIREWIVGLCLLILTGCSPGPAQLTPQQRRGDVEFLCQWARNYSPFVELNERLRGLPNYEAVAPGVMRLAEEAQTDEEFFHVVCGYFSLLGVSGHGHLLSEPSLRTYGYESRRRPGQLPSHQLKAGYRWPRLQERSCFVHPPFRVIRDGEIYRIRDAWQSRDRRIAAGSQIVAVNGMDCTSFLERLRKATWVRHILRDTDWVAEDLLAVHEGPGVRGWQVTFRLADGTTCEAFVPCHRGHPDLTPFCDYASSEGNCICLRLTDEVGYIRVKCMGGMFIEKDRRTIGRFLEESKGRYQKLIIDVRQNGGGIHYYAFDNLIAPFLDRSASYSEVAGIKRRFLQDHAASFLESLRGGVSIFAHERQIEEIRPPEPWNPADWVFYRIDRRVDPKDRYPFSGRLFILMDGGTGSAADEYANASQRMHLATLVGHRTPGSCAPYFNPVMVRLPASGMIFVLEADLMLNADGGVNEVEGTQPDVELPPCQLPDRTTKEALLQDEWVKRILSMQTEARSS